MTPEQIYDFAKYMRKEERRRVLNLWEKEMKCSCEEPMQHLASRIKGEKK